MEKQIERIATALENIEEHLNEIRGQLQVTNRMSYDTTGNMLSEIASYFWLQQKEKEQEQN
jgi:hypothetical protein